MPDPKCLPPGMREPSCTAHDYHNAGTWCGFALCSTHYKLVRRGR